MARTRSKTKSPRRKSPPSAALPAGNAAESTLKIGGAARALGVEAYVLRFWETQFPFLRPSHSRSRHRFYGPEDLATLRLIKRLLHSEGYTIAGAKKHIREVGLEKLLAESESASTRGAANGDRGLKINRPESSGHPERLQSTLAEIKEELLSLRRLLAS